SGLFGKRTEVGETAEKPTVAALPVGINLIAYNALDGVRISGLDTAANTIAQNSIFSNTRLGINLVGGIGENANGVTPNDATDIDPGPNNLQNFPVLTNPAPAATTISGTLDSGTPAGPGQGAQPFRIDVYLNSGVGCDPSTFGE